MFSPNDVESAIKAWEFEDGPDHLAKLSGWGGDEEWIVLIPQHFLGGMPPSHDGWPDLPSHVDKFVLRLTDTDQIEWHELIDGDWVAISYRG